jgi:hypothetical protein
MPTQWTIPASGVTGGSLGQELIGCHIEVVSNAEGTAYEFQQPNGTGVTNTPFASTLPAPPFTFPTFTSDLGGNTSANWSISVSTLTGGPSGNQAQGGWSNPASPLTKPTKPEPPDTWVAQAGPGLDADDCAKDSTDQSLSVGSL